MSATAILADDYTIDTIEGEARICRALSRLAAARAVHRTVPGTPAHRRCLDLATRYADAAERLTRSVESMRSQAA